MNQFIINILIGAGLGLFIVPFVLWIYTLIKKTREKRKIKRMLQRGQFLQPIDPRDYNTKIWANQINVEENKKQLDKLNNIFIKRFKVNKRR